MEESGGKWLLMGHTENLDTHSRQLVGGDPRQVIKNVVYCVYHQSGRSVATKYYCSGNLGFIHFLTGHILVTLALQHHYDGNGMEMEELLNVGAPQLDGRGRSPFPEL